MERVGRAIVPSEVESKMLSRLGGQAGGARMLALGSLIAVREARAFFRPEMKTVFVFVTDRRGRRGEEADDQSSRYEPNRY